MTPNSTIEQNNNKKSGINTKCLSKYDPFRLWLFHCEILSNVKYFQENVYFSGVLLHFLEYYENSFLMFF